MSGLGFAALSAVTLAVWLMLSGAAIGECQLLVLVALVLAVLEVAGLLRQHLPARSGRS